MGVGDVQSADQRPRRCTVVAPGLVDTPFFSEPKPEGLRPDDVAAAVLFALEQPRQVAVGEVYLMPVPGG